MLFRHIFSLDTNKILEIAKKSLKFEINGLQSILNNSINEKFIQLIDIIIKTKGRIILSGVGKPSYIAQKAAATLASTGTPSYFVNSNQASHGDLGMITKEDIVILLSNSGGSMELNDIIAYTKRLGIVLVGVTRKADSFLAKSSTLSIVLENCPQTNPVDSPTTDMIMFLAYLDAVATVLMDLKQFGNDKYRIFHPGGKLGSALIRISEIMKSGSSLPIININKSVPELLNEINKKNLNACVVVDNKGKLVGLVNDSDLRKKIIEFGDITKRKIIDLVDVNSKSIKMTALAVEAVNLMAEKDKYRQVLVVIDEHEKVVGIIHIQDLFKARII